MLGIYKVPQHQHLPAHCAGKETVAKGEYRKESRHIRLGFLLAARSVSLNFKRFYWLGGREVCDRSMIATV